MFIFIRACVAVQLVICAVARAELSIRSWTHDEQFIPDAILRVTARNISQSCLPSKMTVLINGTAPGPELRLREARTTWIRVYNDMTDQNLTMVNEGSNKFQILFAGVSSNSL
jgi:hypothetical protein